VVSGLRAVRGVVLSVVGVGTSTGLLRRSRSVTSCWTGGVMRFARGGLQLGVRPSELSHRSRAMSAIVPSLIKARPIWSLYRLNDYCISEPEAM
jgi:hypothetical protein